MARAMLTPVSALVAPEIKTLDLTVEPEAPLPSFTCTLCPPDAARTFQNSKGLKTHCMRAHGVMKLSRSFIPRTGPLCTTCPGCMKRFESHSRALDHLEYRAKHCRAKMESGALPEHAPALVREADQRDRESLAAQRLMGDTRARALARPKRAR